MPDESDQPRQHPSTRERLLLAARDVVAEVGWAMATSRAVATAAATNVALINYHFGTKEALFAAALERAIVDLAGDAAGPAGGATFDLYQLESLAMHIAHNDGRGPAVRMLYQAMLQAPHDAALAGIVKVHLQAFRTYVISAVRNSVSSGQVSKHTDVVALGNVLAATLDGIILHWMIDPDTDVAAAVHALFSTLRG